MDPHLDFVFFIITKNVLIQPTVGVKILVRQNRYSGGGGGGGGGAWYVVVYL